MGKKSNSKKNKSVITLSLIILLNFIIIVSLVLYIIYIRFIPYLTLEYDGYAVSGNDITSNLLSSNLDGDYSIKALKVSDQDAVYQNLSSYYVGASKENNINLDYPIYVNDSLALYSLSSDTTLITDDFQKLEGYKGMTLSSGALYNSSTLERADYYNYILLKNSDGLYMNTKEIKIETALNSYTIPMNSIINFARNYITYYTLNGEDFVYSKILDMDTASAVIVEDYDKEYTYEEFLVGLGLIKATTTDDDTEEENIETNTTVNTVVNTVVEEPIIEEEEPQEEEEEPNDEDSDDSTVELVWTKPTVTCDGFVANVYSATTKVSITDPSKVIYNAVTFTFYKDGEIAFRTSTAASNTITVTKLLPDTTYTIIGTYQYRNKEGSLIENTILEQEITTKSVKTLNTIDLGFENGQIYYNKIELTNLHIESSIDDEAINGVSKAEVLINGTKYSVSSATLRSILKGESVTYQSSTGLASNTECDYEIVFYDTAGNVMDLSNNTGSTRTSKKAPSVTVKVSAQEIVSVTIDISMLNDDDVDIKNYRYALYSSTGEVIANGILSGESNTLTFGDLDPEYTYTIKVYADFDLKDGNGTQYNQEIGNSTFTTLSLKRLGTLKLDVSYDEDTDITCNSANITIGINTSKTDNRLIAILKTVTLKIQNSSGDVVSETKISDISSLQSNTGLVNEIENLNSNSTYKIVITATALQGSTEEEITTTYTTTSFTTNKEPATLSISNVVTTTSIIDMDIYIDDTDGSCQEGIVTIRLTDTYGKEYVPSIEPSSISSNTSIPTNEQVRLTYTGLTEGETYTLQAEVAIYNETNNSNKVQNNVEIGSTKFVTTGLGGTLELLGLERTKTDDGANLIDVKSENNWYSKCFDVMTNEYIADDANQVTFTINSTYNYEKTYTEDDDNIYLKLLSNQCYVYDFSAYAGQTVTISFMAKTTEAEADIYLQLGKEIGGNIEQITGLKTGDYVYCEKTVTVPSDGYIGFYLEKYTYEQEIARTQEEIDAGIEAEYETIEEPYYLEVKSLQVELGSTATAYSKFEYNFLTTLRVNFIDENHLTYDSTTDECRYYIRITSSNGEVTEYSYTYESYENIEEIYKYITAETENEVEYTIELIIKQYNREYSLSSVTYKYDPEDCAEIKSISTVEEFKEIQPYGNYIILEDLDLTNSSTESEYTFGNPTISFYGSIDFNGKTISKDTYSLSRAEETTSYIFYKLEDTAVIKNIVIDFNINNKKNRYTVTVVGSGEEFINEEDGIYSLFLYNYAEIDNVILTLTGCTEKERMNVGLLGYTNYGTIENFVVNFKTTLYGSQYLAGVCLYSSGTIQNGYLYGKGIEAIGNITTGDYRNIGGVVYQVDGSGLLQNIYNISTITINHCDSTYSYGANIAYNVGYPPILNDAGVVTSSTDSTAIVRNVYSVQSIITVFDGEEYYCLFDSDNKQEYIGPNILNTYTSTTVNESYYFCDVTYEASDNNTKTSATALYEAGVQELMLNANGYSMFIIDTYVSNGYYPKLNLNSCMPEQENNKISIDGVEIIDILSASVVEDNDYESTDASDKVKSEIATYIQDNSVDLTDENQVIVEFRIYNPAGTTISEINLNYVTTSIISQSYSKKVSTVYALLNNPTSYLNEYDAESIKSKMANGTTLESVYGENEELGTRTIEVTFVKRITSEEEWYNINNEDANGISGLIQNYRLAVDLDFSSSEYAPYITGDFTGYLDGECDGVIHTISNIEGSQSLIESFSEGTIQNLYIENFTINTSEQYAGLIRYTDTTDNIIIDNVHISNMSINSSYSGSTPCYGGFFGALSNPSSSASDSTIIQNCSIKGLEIEFTNAAVSNIQVGGIIGYYFSYGGVETYISNCYVQNLDINAKNVSSCSGIGGIIGYNTHTYDENVKAGEPVVYVQNCYTTGKIKADMYVGGIVGRDMWGNLYATSCYSMVNITSSLNSGNGYIGGIEGYTTSGSTTKVQKNLYLGNIYVSGNSVNCVNRILGSATGTSSYKNYAYSAQLMNGNQSTSTMGATKLLTYDEIFQMYTYSSLLSWDDNYAYTIELNGDQFDLLENNYLPQLNDTEGNILYNQTLNTLDNDLILDSITSTPSSDQTEVTIVMVFQNPNQLNLTTVKIENDDMQIVDGSWEAVINGDTTTVTFTATPNRAYDSYKIEYIYYERNGQTIEKELSAKIKVELYVGISNAQEWNEFFDSSTGQGRLYEGQNIKIQGTIDFSEVSYIEYNVVVGRIEADSTQIITNVNLSSLTANQGLIKEIKTSLKNLTFTDSTIKGSGSYVGLISVLRGASSNCKFSNIEVNCTGNYDYIGIISKCIGGSFNNVTIDNVVVKGRHYVGGLCGQASSLSTSSKITGTYICITATGNYAGGLFGTTSGSAMSNIYAYQYSADGKQNGDTTTSWLVSGVNYVGGCIGYSSTSVTGSYCTNSTIKGTTYVGSNTGYTGYSTTTAVATNNTITGSGNYVGGNVGYTGWTSATTLTSTDNTITGVNYVGGNIGGAGRTTINKLTATDNTIKATNNYAGGCVGFVNSVYSIATTLRSSGSSQTISGKNYVGGTVGYTNGRVRDSKTEDCKVTGTGNYVGGAIGYSTYSTTSISSTSNGNYAVAGASVSGVTIKGSLNYVGGVVGYQIGTLYGGAVDSCTITAAGDNAGGIAGYYTGYSGTASSYVSASTFFLWHSYCTNSVIRGDYNVGGIVGYYVMGNIQYCYLGNSTVIADSLNSGGIVGYFDNSKLSNLQYKATIKYNFVANADDDEYISAYNSAGGLIGSTASKLNYSEDIDSYSYVECNLIVTDLYSTGSYIDIGIGSVANRSKGTTQSAYMNNIYAWNCSCINGVQLGGITEEAEGYSLVSSSQLSVTSIFTKNTKLTDEEGTTIGYEGLNFGTGRYSYTAGYFPILKNSYSAQLYWGSSNLNVVQSQIAIPTRTEDFDSNNTVSLETLSIASVATTMSLEATAVVSTSIEELPSIYVYASGIDTINVEFSAIDQDTYFTIEVNEQEIFETNVNQRVYTLQYNYLEPLTITMDNGYYWQTIEISAEDVQNLLLITDDEYFYISDNNLYSNKRTIEGTFVNIYDGKALDDEGNIYNIITMQCLSSQNIEICLLDEAIPLQESEYGDYTIQTYAHCSKVIESDDTYAYKDQQIFIKNGNMYIVDGSLNSVAGAIIIDSYNGNQYEAILGTDGILYDLMSTEINYPEEFENENIIAMTNNVNSDSTIVLVYYSNGRVYGFNYITGAEVYDNGVTEEEEESFVSYLLSSFTSTESLYSTSQEDYDEAQELVAKLETVSIDEAIAQISEEDGETESSETSSSSTSTTQQYITSYDSTTQTYVVYSTDELLSTTSETVQTENEKINSNYKLVAYYAELSVGTQSMKNIGIIIISIIVAAICVILIILNRKTKR